MQSPDKRVPEYAEYGAPTGFPVMVFHGTPGSHLERIFSEPALRDSNIRLIVVERPGYGLSEFQDDRTLLDWPDEILRLADRLELDRFSVAGFSGGGPYAAACAYKIADRLVHTALISSAAPYTVPGLTDAMPPGNRALFELARDDYQTAAQQLATAIDSPESLFELFEASASAPDKAVLCSDGFRAMYQANLAESIRQGMTGPAYDMALIAGPWGFEPGAITTSVSVWHGKMDLNTPPAMGRYLAETIPACRKHIFTNHGHFLASAHETKILHALSDG